MHAAWTTRAVVAFAWALGSPGALAATSCSLAVGQIAFGAYNVFDLAPRDTHTTMQLSCTRNGGPQHVQVTISISPSPGAQRTLRLAGGSDMLHYQLYRDAARTAVWGDTPGVDTHEHTVSVPNHSTVQSNVTVFGRIHAGQDVRPGLYSDTVTIRVMP